MSTSADPDRDPDPTPEQFGVVTDFSEIWRLGAAQVAPGYLPEPERDYTLGVLSTFGTERVEFDVLVPVRTGRHFWFETRHMVVYRTVKPQPKQSENRRTA